MTQTPPFAEIVATFEKFVAEHGFSTDFVWVFKEDVTNLKHRVWIRMVDPDQNYRLAMKYYDIGRERGLGVSLCVLCHAGGKTACYVWVPEDEIDAEYAMQTALRFKAPVNSDCGFIVTSNCAWWWQCFINWLQGRVSFAYDIPSRRDVISHNELSPKTEAGRDRGPVNEP